MAALLAFLVALAPSGVEDPTLGWCATFHTTGYSSDAHPGRTRDGTPTRGNEWTLASVDPRVVPLQSKITIPSLIDEWGIGELRAADTGGGVRGLWIDVLTTTDAQAYRVTGDRLACVKGPDL